MYIVKIKDSWMTRRDLDLVILETRFQIYRDVCELHALRKGNSLDLKLCTS